MKKKNLMFFIVFTLSIVFVSIFLGKNIAIANINNTMQDRNIVYCLDPTTTYYDIAPTVINISTQELYNAAISKS